METLEKIIALLACVAFGYLLGIFIPKLKKRNTSRGHKNLAKNPFDTSKEEEEKRKEEETKKLATRILQSSVRNEESFVKMMKQFTIPSNIATFSIIAEILKMVKILYFDELVDVLKDNCKSALPEEINIQKRTNLPLNEADLLLVINSVGLERIFPLIIDENFEDGNSLKIFKRIEEEFSTDYFLVKYLCESDGEKHWDNPEAEQLIISALIEIENYSEDKWTPKEKEFVSHFYEEFQIIKSLFRDNSKKDFVEILEKSAPENIAKVFKYVDLSDDCDEGYNAFSLLIDSPKFFKIWIENTSIINIINDDDLFYYLVWNDILPDELKEDNRYSQAKEIQEGYKFSQIDLNLIKDFDSNKNLIEYLQNHCDEEAFIDDYIADKKFIPCLFWYTLENEEWEKISQEDAQEKLEENEHYTPYLHLSYILEGYEYTEKVLRSICDNELVDIAQLYFEKHHKQYFI